MTRNDVFKILEAARAAGVRANLSGANLGRADLSGADLSGANLGDLIVLQLGPMGSRRDYLVVRRSPRTPVEVSAGCWSGSLDAFAARVDEVYPGSAGCRHGREYRAAIQMVRALMSGPSAPDSEVTS